MTYFGIPVNTQFPWQSIRIALSSVTYTLSFRFNSRSQRWVMDINDGSNNPILSGLVLLINEDLTYQYKNTFDNLPPGTFFVLDNTGQSMEPGPTSFGVTHTLFYADPTQ